MEIKRDGFTSRFGIIAAAAGSAIGLGNIWKFPYITGQNGGGAFLIVYLACILVIGIPVMVGELMIGRRGQKNAVGSFKALSKNPLWQIPGWLAISVPFLILSFYGVVAGWTLKYIVATFQGGFAGKSSEEIGTFFSEFITNPTDPIMYQIIFMVLTAAIVILGVHKGIENASRILMPLLLVIILILNVRAVTLPGGSEGLKFLFQPDFSQLTKEGVLEALGHAFFTLSLGMGIMLTYGSYIKKDVSLGATALQVSAADTIIALLAGVAIFPAVFAFGIEPASGPGLVFITLPNIFQQIPGGTFFELIFFMLLAVAALTSTVSLLEVTVAFVKEEFKLGRKRSTILVATLITILGAFTSLSMSPESSISKLKFSDYNLFDAIDKLTGNIMLPVVALLITIFAGWFMDKKAIDDELTSGGLFKAKYRKVFMVLIRFISPFLIVLVLLSKIMELKAD